MVNSVFLKKKKKKINSGPAGGRREGGRPGLTLERNDEHVAILDEILDEFVRPLQLDFVTFDPLPEVRTVQERVTELQSGESHRASTTKQEKLPLYSLSTTLHVRVRAPSQVPVPM